jgi:multiple RNA-binding domain-containing protein 1
VTKEELSDAFGKFGKIIDIEIPFRKKGKGVPLGIGFIRYETSEAAISAYAEMDKTFF